MLKFLERSEPSLMSIYFRGSPAPRAENFGDLRSHGIDVQPAKAREGMHWALSLRHPEWGEAALFSPKDLRLPRREEIAMSAGLHRYEREAFEAAGCGIVMRVASKRASVLRDRKNALRFASAVMGREAIGLSDHASYMMWSRESVLEEVAHDADLDVGQLVCVHNVLEDGDDDGERRVLWMHTHGLAKLGAFDIDILNPSDDLAHGEGFDVVRSLMWAIVEGHVSPSESDVMLAHPGGRGCLVPAGQFMAKASAAFTDLRDAEGHTDDRSVVCEKRGGMLGMFGSKPRPNRFLSSEFRDGMTVPFTAAATELMADRARGTSKLFREFAGEFEEFGATAIAKLGYETDSGGREHLWFEVHGTTEHDMEATLGNQPFDIARMNAGDRGRHSWDRLSDWRIMTPVGSISPSQLRLARAIRENPEAVRTMAAMMAAMSGAG